MEKLKNIIVSRIQTRNNLILNLFKGKQYQTLLLQDILFQQQKTIKMNNLQVTSIQSKILNQKRDFTLITKFLKQNHIKAYNKISKIFRASDFQFSSKAYHTAVQGKSPTLTVIKTKLNRKFGAFLNCKIEGIDKWIGDSSGQSFIFSLDHEEIYKLKTEANYKQKAAFGGNVGPQIGSGCDIYIGQNFHEAATSGANLGGSYELPNHIKFNTPKSRSYLAGQQLFIVSDFQVFVLE